MRLSSAFIRLALCELLQARALPQAVDVLPPSPPLDATADENANQATPRDRLPSTDPSADPTCLPLADSIYCGAGWGDHYLDITVNADRQDEPGWLPAQPSNQTVEAFDLRLSEFFWQQAPEVSELYYGCTWATRKWFVSYTCAILIDSSSRCNSGLPSAVPGVGMRPFCRQDCLNGSRAVEKSFDDASVCKLDVGERTREDRQKTLASMRDACDRSFASGEEGACVAGRDAEPGMCDRVEYMHFNCARQACDKAERNPICRDAPEAVKSMDTESLSGDSAGSATPAKSSSLNSLAPGAVVVIVFLVIFALIILVVLIRTIRQSASRRTKPGRMATATASGSFGTSIGAPMNVQTSLDDSKFLNKLTAGYPKAEEQKEQNRGAPESGAQLKPKDQGHHSDNMLITTLTRDHATVKGPDSYPAGRAPAGDDHEQLARTTLDTGHGKGRLPALSMNRSSSHFSRGRSQSAGDGSAHSTLTSVVAAAAASAAPDGHHYIAICPYTPTLNDEMELLPNDVITISQKYDDGWAYGLNLSTGQLGVFPLGFVTQSSNQELAGITIRDSTFSNKKNSIAGQRFTQVMNEAEQRLAVEGHSAPGEVQATGGGSEFPNPAVSQSANPGTGSIAALMAVLDRIGEDKGGTGKEKPPSLACGQGIVSSGLSQELHPRSENQTREIDELDVMLKEEERRMQDALSSLNRVQRNQNSP